MLLRRRKYAIFNRKKSIFEFQIISTQARWSHWATAKFSARFLFECDKNVWASGGMCGSSGTFNVALTKFKTHLVREQLGLPLSVSDRIRFWFCRIPNQIGRLIFWLERIHLCFEVGSKTAGDVDPLPKFNSLKSPHRSWTGEFNLNLNFTQPQNAVQSLY